MQDHNEAECLSAFISSGARDGGGWAAGETRQPPPESTKCESKKPPGGPQQALKSVEQHVLIPGTAESRAVVHAKKARVPSPLATGFCSLEPRRNFRNTEVCICMSAARAAPAALLGLGIGRAAYPRGKKPRTPPFIPARPRGPPGIEPPNRSPGRTQVRGAYRRPKLQRWPV